MKKRCSCELIFSGPVLILIGMRVLTIDKKQIDVCSGFFLLVNSNSIASIHLGTSRRY